jgi:hypothetical protein
VDTVSNRSWENSMTTYLDSNYEGYMVSTGTSIAE